MRNSRRPVRVLLIGLLIWAARTANANPVAVPRDGSVRVAAVSFVPQKFDLQGNADRLERAFRLAAKGGTKLAVAPEGALDGYVVNEIISGAAALE